jgi:hypothetical protein
VSPDVVGEIESVCPVCEQRYCGGPFDRLENFIEQMHFEGIADVAFCVDALKHLNALRAAPSKEGTQP